MISTSDYYPFGSQMPQRNFTSNEYRYGFNGMEKDDAISGSGNSYTTQFRQYDSRLGRWFSIDPLEAKFPWQSPYVAFDNNPILINDPNGLAGKKKNGVKDKEKGKKKAAKAENKFEKKYYKFKKRNRGSNVNKDDFIYHSIDKKWYKKYEENITGSTTNWDVKMETVKVSDPEVDFDKSIPSQGVNTKEYIFDVGISDGVVLLDIEAFSAPDRFQILNAETNEVIFDTERKVAGRYKTTGEIKFNLGKGTKIKVIVNPQGKKQGKSYYLFRILVDAKSIRNKMFKTKTANTSSENK